MATKVVIYGLSTEGYSLACQIALNGGDVQIIDESTPSAISIKEEGIPVSIIIYNFQLPSPFPSFPFLFCSKFLEKI